MGFYDGVNGHRPGQCLAGGADSQSAGGFGHPAGGAA